MGEVVPMRQRTTTDQDAVTWLVEQGFPFDWQTQDPPPDEVMRAVLWTIMESDGGHYENSYDTLTWAVQSSTGWDLAGLWDV